MPRPGMHSGGAFIMDQAIETSKERKQQSNKTKDTKTTKVPRVAKVNKAADRTTKQAETTAGHTAVGAPGGTILGNPLFEDNVLAGNAEAVSNLLYAEPQRGLDGRWKKLTETEQRERAVRVMGIANGGVMGGVSELDSDEEEAAFEYDQDMIDLQEELNAKRGPVNPPDEDQARPNGRVHGRQLVKWNIHADQTLLLCIQYECYKNHVKIPWKKVALRMAAEKKPSAQCIIQHLSKVRLHMLDTGRWVPPLMGRTNQQFMASNTDGRGMVKCVDPETEKITFRDVEWDENLDDLVGPPCADPRILPTRSVGGRKRYETVDYNPAPTLTRSTVVANPTATLTGAGKRWSLTAQEEKKSKKNNGVKRAYRRKPKKTEIDDLIEATKVVEPVDDDQGGFVRRSKRARRASVEYQESVAGSDSDASLFVAEEGSVVSPEDRLAIRNTLEEIRREDDHARMMAAATKSPAIPTKPRGRKKNKVNKKVVVLKTGNIANHMTHGAPDDMSHIMTEDVTPMNQPLLFEDMLGDSAFMNFVDSEVDGTDGPVANQTNHTDSIGQHQNMATFNVQQSNMPAGQPQVRPAWFPTWVFEDVNGQAFCHDPHGYVTVYNPETNKTGPYDSQAFFHKQMPDGRLGFYHKYGETIRGRQPGGLLREYSNLDFSTSGLSAAQTSGSGVTFHGSAMNNENVSNVYQNNTYSGPSDLGANAFEDFGVEPVRNDVTFGNNDFAFDYNFTVANNNATFQGGDKAVNNDVVYQGHQMYAAGPVGNELAAINSGTHTVDPMLENFPWVNGGMTLAHHPTNDNMEHVIQSNIDVADDVDLFADIDFSGLD